MGRELTREMLTELENQMRKRQEAVWEVEEALDAARRIRHDYAALLTLFDEHAPELSCFVPFDLQAILLALRH